MFLFLLFSSTTLKDACVVFFFWVIIFWQFHTFMYNTFYLHSSLHLSHAPPIHTNCSASYHYAPTSNSCLSLLVWFCSVHRGMDFELTNIGNSVFCHWKQWPLLPNDPGLPLAPLGRAGCHEPLSIYNWMQNMWLVGFLFLDLFFIFFKYICFCAFESKDKKPEV